MTADPKITSEIKQVFDILERKIVIPKTKNILISPFSTRSTILKLIEQEMDNHTNGEAAYIIMKMNSLQDRDIIQKLYKASQAGVKIDLLVRGVCCLVPGVENESENIRVISIVDRFLEHARVFIFANGGDEKIYIGSADIMTRNLDHRIEVLIPLLDQEIKQKVRKTIDLQLNESVKGRIIDTEQSNEYVALNDNVNESSQHQIYDYIKGQVLMQ